MRKLSVVALLGVLLLPLRLGAQQEADSLLGARGITSANGRFRLGAEVKLNFRSSSDVSLSLPNADAPVPVVLQTVAPGSSFEVSNLILTGDGELATGLNAHFMVTVIDLYNRNPTSTDDKIFLREAWFRYGKKVEWMEPNASSSAYVQIGKAPRFTRRPTRWLDSYGLWETAVGRFEEIGAEIGGSAGGIFYTRLAVSNGNPLFFRDPNALAGDAGAAAPASGSTAPTPLNSGFPIFYDGKAQDVNFNGSLQWGTAIGVKLIGPQSRNGIELLFWYFSRTLSEDAPINGSEYGGDLRLLRALGVSLQLQGSLNQEWGTNAEARFGPLRVWGQWVRQKIAGLGRAGYEIQGAWRFPLGGLFAAGDQPVGNWLTPSVRFSRIQTDFEMPSGSVAPSVGWDWAKWDFGARLGLVRGLDLTVEYALNDATTKTGTIHPNEWLVTVRTAF